MITVIKQPAGSVLSRNDVVYLLETNNLILTAGLQAKISLVVTSLSGNTGNFSLTFLGITVTWTGVSGSPSPTAYEFKTGTFANYTDYGNHLISMLKKHKLLDDNYDITIDVVGAFIVILKIKAKQKGILYNISGTQTTANIVFGLAVAGIDTVTRDNFKILHDVFFEQNYLSGNFEKIFSSAGIPNEALQCEFNIADVLSAKLKYHVPAFAGTDYFLNTAAKRYCTRYAESYGYPIEVSPTGVTNAVLAVLGAQNFAQAAQNNFATTYINTTSPHQFLTNMPKGTVITKQQRQFLSFYATGVILFRLYLDLYYTDNTHEVQNIDYTPTPYSGIYTFEVGYNQLDIDGLKNPAKTVSKYVVSYWDATADEVYTEDFEFQVSQMPQLFERNILFFNSFGMPETINFTGKQLTNFQFKTDLVRKASVQFNTDAQAYQGEMQEINNELQYNYELNSGYKTQAWLLYFTDFVLSRLRYLQGTDKWLGINIPAQKISLLEDDKQLIAVKFNYQDAWFEKGVGQ